MSVSTSQASTLPTLAAAPLPRHVRDLLVSTLRILSDELAQGLDSAYREFERTLHRPAEQLAGKDAQQRLQKTQEQATHARADLQLDFMRALEAELCNLRDPQVIRGHLQASFRSGDAMCLVNDLEIEETSLLTDSATRAELQNSLQLFLLGQRFGVLAGRPAFDNELLPVGPQALCRSARRAAERMSLDVEFRLMFYRAFDRTVMAGYGSLVEAVNSNLARHGVLPSLQYVPVRARRVAQKPGSAVPLLAEVSDAGLSLLGGDQSFSARGELHGRSAGYLPGTAAQSAGGYPGGSRAQGGPSPAEQLELLRQLMAGRRQLLGKLNADRSRDSRESSRPVSASDLQAALRGLQQRPVAPVVGQGGTTARNIGHLKQDMMALLRRFSPDQQAPALADEHNDALDLVGMLYDNLMKDVKPGSTTASLLTRLQVPLMRVALQDPAFFTESEHPARQMLGTIADTGIQWLGDDETDGGLAPQLNSIVERAVSEYQDDAAMFGKVLQEIQTHLHTLGRKAEVAERRHVEAARGKEKLTLARKHATEHIEALVKGQKLPRFTKTMLTQAWTDVMALTALRHGETSPAWLRQLEVAQRLLEIARHPAGDHVDSMDAGNSLQREIEDGLAKVGYQGEDVRAIADRLVHPNAGGADEASSRTELTMRLKAQARLGEELPGSQGRHVALTSTEAAHRERIQQAPIGTWFEFLINPQGDRARRRLAWLSTSTGAALFVNQRGQKNAEYTLDSLARLMARGQVRIVEEEGISAVDRAWDNVVAALRSFALPESSETAK